MNWARRDIYFQDEEKSIVHSGMHGWGDSGEGTKSIKTTGGYTLLTLN